MKFFLQHRSVLLFSLPATFLLISLPALAQKMPTTPAASGTEAKQTISGPYRLTYTLTEMDGIKRVGSQKYSLTLNAGTRAVFNVGSKIPIETDESQTSPPRTQVSYIDVGVNIDAHLIQAVNGFVLDTRVLQSAVDSQQSLLKTPVIRQTTVSDTALINENKPVLLGSAVIPGSTRVQKVEVELTRIQ